MTKHGLGTLEKGITPKDYEAIPNERRYYRIQPKGLGINHYSEDSSGETNSLHVFETPELALAAEGNPTDYGDEVVELTAPGHHDNGDVEGVAVNPKKAKVLKRWALDDFAKEHAPDIVPDEDAVSLAWADTPHWGAYRNNAFRKQG